MRCLLLFLFVLTAGRSFGQDQSTLEGPKQPIDFNHKLHVSELKQQCKVCHPNNNPGEMMGMPEVATCMGCHSSLPAQSASTRKLAAFAKQARDIDWVRIYQIPTFVSFNHRTHIQAGATCESCHGPAGERVLLAKEKDTSMGSCVNCHLAKHASIDCGYCHSPR